MQTYPLSKLCTLIPISGMRSPSRYRNRAQVPHGTPESPHSSPDASRKKASLSKTLTPVSARPHILPPQQEPDPEIIKIQQTSKSRPITGRSKSRLRPITPVSESDSSLDIFLSKVATMPLDAALESFFKQFFQAKLVIAWQEVPNLQLLYSSATNTTTMHSSGLVGYSFFSRTIIRCGSGPTHPSYQPDVDERFFPLKAPLLVFPLWDWKNNLLFVVQIVRSVQAAEFTAEDEGFIEWFTEKFKTLSRWLIQPKDTDSLTLDLLKVMTHDEFFASVIPKLAVFFKAKQFELWKMDKETGDIWRYTNKKEKINANIAGIAGDSLSREQTVSCVNNRLHRSYNAETDGPGDEAVLAYPVLDQETKSVYALVLRGPENSRIFLLDDELLVKKAAPTVLLCLKNIEALADREKEYKTSKVEKEGLSALLEVAEVIASQLDSEKLIEMIIEKGRELTDADRCSLFLVNETRDRLISYLHHGLPEPIDIPISRGVAGKAVSEGKILNIPDVYETDFFDSTTDQETGYRTKSILSVPIYNNRGEIIGVTEMVNKYNSQTFSQWDARVIQIFNVFCGISLENSRLFRESTYMANQVKSFFNISFALSRSENTQRLLYEIMGNAKNLVNATYGSIFLVDTANNVLSTFVSDQNLMPPTIPVSIGVAGHCVKTKEGAIVNNPYLSPFFNRTLDTITKCKTKSLCVAPIISQDGTVIGVAEMMNKQKGDFVSKDLHTLTAFAQFAAVALEKSRLKDIAEFGDEEIELNKWIGTSEKNGYGIPRNLTLFEDQQRELLSLNCFAVNYKGIGHVKEIFYFFHRFKLLETFNISNEQFFRFVFAISATYNQVPYHNWTHACDVTQYVTYQLVTAELDKVYDSQEILGLMVSAVCHDANHEGFNNVFNVKAETPFGILFKDQSVMEMHHITVSIPIITRDDINLFHALSPNDTKKMWNLIIKLILATDMARHFDLVKQGQALLDEGKFDINDTDSRILSLELLLKVADISNVSRPFQIADKWCDILCNEFFRQGDIEKASGIGLTSPLNDRASSDKPKSQVGFYNFVCLPLYQTVARMFPQLQVNADSVNANLEVWKSMIH